MSNSLDPDQARLCIGPDMEPKIVSEYDQEIPQSQTVDKPMAPRGKATHTTRDTRKTNLSKATRSLFPNPIIGKHTYM